MVEQKCPHCKSKRNHTCFIHEKTKKVLKTCSFCREQMIEYKKKKGIYKGNGQKEHRIVHVTRNGKKYKTCTRCQKELGLENFSKDSRLWDKLRRECKACIKDRSENLTEDQIKDKAAKMAIYKKENKEKIAKRAKVWQAENKDKINARKKERRDTDPQFKLYNILGSRIRDSLKSQNVDKLHRTMDLSGCTPQFLKEYIEDLFEEGMTWENHGNDHANDWHIDHIRPCASFDLRDEDQQRQCYHYTNLQPLWGIDNIRKGDTWFPEDHIYHNEKWILDKNGKEIEVAWTS